MVFDIHHKSSVAEGKDTTRVAKGERVIPIILEEGEYDKFMEDRVYARGLIMTQFQKFPQLFPMGMENFVFNGFTHKSQKMKLKKRQIKVQDTHYQLCPSFVLPDMRGRIDDDICKGLLLCRYGVAYWLVAEVMGRNESFWYRLHQSFSKNSIVGCTVYGSETKVPKDILSDEKHIKIKKVRHYLASVIGKDCILGSEVSESADEKGLTKAYGVFKEEANSVEPSYQPKSINTDGWAATIKAMNTLFPLAVLIRCFLHAFLKIKNVATKKVKEEFDQCSEMVWEVYRAENSMSFSQRVRRLREWATQNMKAEKIREAVLKLCDRRDEFKPYFDNNNAHRTSNMLDRLMRLMDRRIFKAQGFHGSKEAANAGMRAFALLYNFAPSCPKSRKDGFKSPAERLNGFCFSENWVENLLIASSMNGRNRNHVKPK